MLVCAGLAACGSGSGSGSGSGGPGPTSVVPQLPSAGDLPGWRAVDADPGIGELAPDLEGLTMVSRSDSPALVRAGDVIRATALVFATPKEAKEALKRASGDDYQAAIEEAFHGDTAGRGPGVGYRLSVPRPTGTGTDTVEVMLVANGRTLALVELVSAGGFDPKLRSRILALVKR